MFVNTCNKAYIGCYVETEKAVAKPIILPRHDQRTQLDWGELGTSADSEWLQVGLECGDGEGGREAEHFTQTRPANPVGLG